MMMWLGVLAVGTGCNKAAVVGPPEGVGPTVSPQAHVYLRNSFDTDPSVYLGRFVPPDVADLDETAAMPTRCSALLEPTRIGGGGVLYDETFTASQAAALRIGVPGVASGQAGAERGAVVRVKYTLDEKLVANPSDPGAFEDCCKAAPDQCTDRYVGEFLSGTGTVYYEVNESAGLQADGAATKAAGEFEIRHGTTWKRAIEFPNPVFFAFKTTENRFSGATTGGCGDWTDAPPRSTQGQYFVGISPPVATEAEARDLALTSGRSQAVRYVAESVDAGRITTTATAGEIGNLTSTLDSESTVQSAASGIANLVKDEAWCVTPEATPGGNRYLAKVLMLLPRADEAAAAAAVVAAP